MCQIYYVIKNCFWFGSEWMFLLKKQKWWRRREKSCKVKLARVRMNVSREVHGRSYDLRDN
jgi:hypothetical protein